MEVITDDETITGKYLIHLLNWKQTFFLILLKNNKNKKQWRATNNER